MDNFSLSVTIPSHITTQTPSACLWNKAVQKLDDIDKQHIDFHRHDRRAVLEELLQDVAKKKQFCEAKQWKFRKRNGEVVFIRESLDQVVEWVRRFREVGDVVMQYDPAHAALPWAGCRLLLQIAVNDSETYGAMTEGVEMVSGLVAQYAKVEELYLHGVSVQRDLLEQRITELYVAILIYLLRAREYYNRPTAGRITRSIVYSSSSVEKYLKSISEKSSKVDEVARLIDADFMHKMARFMAGKFHELNNRLDGLEDRFEGIQLSLRTYLFRSNVGLERLLAWLNAIFTDEDWEKARNSRTPRTCRWILERAKFRDWATSVTATNVMRILWIHGPPGFGKTVLSASIVEHLQNENPARVAHFFCVSDHEAKRQPLAIIRSWVAQMVRQNREALEAAEEAYHGKEGRLATTYDVWQLFTKICQRIPNCYFVVDGFDECIKTGQNMQFISSNDVVSFLQGLISISKETPSRILLVSREDADVRFQFRRLAELSSTIFFDYEISILDTQDDIKSFSASTVGDNLPKKPSSLREEIATEVSKRCMGMFLWIRLLGDRLNPGKNAKQLREMVRKMPVGIEETYERDLVRILKLGEEKDRAIAILRWTLFALRPLTVRELTEALAVNVDPECDAYLRDDLPDTWEEEEVNDQVRRLCGSLIELRGREEQHSPQEQTVHFVHFSVREYLSKATDVNIPSLGTICLSHATSENDLLSQICLRYISYNDLIEEKIPTNEVIQRKMDKYRFLRYAAKFWYIHAHQSGEWSGELVDLTNRFFEPKDCRWILWSNVLQQEGLAVEKDIVSVLGEPGNISPVYYASWLGFMHPLRHLQSQGLDRNETGGVYDGALHAAARNGHLDVVKFLVEQRAEVNVKKPDGSTPLYLAAANGHLDVVKFLVEQRAEVNVKKPDGSTPLYLAAANGHLDIVKFLVEQQAEVNAKGPDGWTSLHSAAHNGYLDVVKFLVEQQAEVNAEEKNGWTPLHSAAQNDYLDVFKFLVEQQADINVKVTDGWTPLHLAAANGHLDVVKFLVEQQAEVNVKVIDGWTPLHLAAAKDHLDVVKFLVEQQAEVNTKGPDGSTPLHSLAHSDHLDVVKLLAEQQAEMNAKEKNGWTPLHLAAANSHLDVVKLLVEQQAEVNAKKDDGWTPLHSAAQNGHLGVVKFLIEQQAEVNAKKYDGSTPLHSAAQNGHLDVVKFLVEQQVEVNTKKDDGWTPLHSAAHNGYLDVAKFLVEQQAEVNAKKHDGWTPLHSAAANGHLDVVKLLVEQRAEVNAKSTFGSTPVHVAIYSSDIETAKFLVELGADVSVLDGYGRSALDWAFMDEAMFHQMGKHSSTYVPTLDAVRVERLRRSVVQISESLLETKQRRLHLGFYELGHCFIFLQQYDEACFSFQQQIVNLHEEGSPIHEVCCDICNDSDFIGSRFVCMTCPNIDLCAPCMQKYPQVGKMRACQNHEFLAVSRPPPHSNEPEGIDASPDGVQGWLRRLVVCYSEPEHSVG